MPMARALNARLARVLAMLLGMAPGVVDARGGIFTATGPGKDVVRGLRCAGSLMLAVLVLGHAQAAAEVRVFVTNEKSDDVTVVEAAGRTVVGTGRVGRRPGGVVSGAVGR